MENRQFLRVEPDRILSREDPAWAHPLIREGWPATAPTTMFETLYKWGKTPEGQAAADALFEQNTAMMDGLPLMPHQEPLVEQVTEARYLVPGCPEEPDAPKVEISVTMPKSHEGNKLPVILYLPGGGLLVSSLSMFRGYALEFATKYQAAIVMPHYRCLPYHMYPKALNDCHATYQWVVQNPDGLPIDTDNITLGGVSSGSHLALCLGFRLKRHGYSPRGIVVENPISDDRAYLSSSRTFTYQGDLDPVYIKQYSVAYVGPYDSGTGLLGPEAFANYATVEECKGYAPTFILTSEYDPDRSYAREFAGKLTDAGVACEYHQWIGGGHAASAVQAPGTAKWVEPNAYLKDWAYTTCTTCDLRRS